MITRLAAAAGLVLALLPAAGCCVLEDVSGNGAFAGCRTRGERLISHTARGGRDMQGFVDTYFVNYDVRDVYRGDLKYVDGRSCCDVYSPCCGK
jgi:hypothetical protein